MAVRHDLDFDVTRLFDEFLDENPIVTKTRARLIARTFKSIEAFVIIARNAHAFATAAGTGLEHDGIADVVRNLDGLLCVFDDIGVAGNRVDVGLVRQFLRRDLVAHRLDGLGLRPYESNALLGQSFAERRVLGQEPVARVHRLCASVDAGLDDAVRNEIGLGRWRGADVYSFVG